jgi:hypothetical protein
MGKFVKLENVGILMVENDPTICDTLTVAFNRIGCRLHKY